MSVITSRAGKGSELSHNELDANFARTTRQVTTTDTVLVSDNRSVIEGNHVDTPFTVTLPTVADAGSEDISGDFETTFTNINVAVMSIDGDGTETINGSTDTIDLIQWGSVTVKLDSAGTGWNTLARTPQEAKTKIIEIGDWDMDTNSSVSGIATGLTYADIRSISVLIRDDSDADRVPLDSQYTDSLLGKSIALDSTSTVQLFRILGGTFDNGSYDSTSYNRGWITITYV